MEPITQPVWHALTPEAALETQGVDAGTGLSSTEVAKRTQTFGPNKFTEQAGESRWSVFLRQYRDPMQIVLLAAGVVCLFLPGQFMTGVARVRRDDQLAEVPMDELVPGDIVNVEAGDLVPADGRIIRAATLEIDESALTGESAPVPKQTDAVAVGA